MSENKDIPFEQMNDRGEYTSNISSAETIVPMLIDYVHPASVIDIGCATGVWLNQFKLNAQNRVRVCGVDGEWLKDCSSFLNDDEIVYFDLEDTNAPFPVKDRFDLAICLENAEHISRNRADFLIDTLTKLTDIVYFSAATPFSGGQHHVNERWQSYWLNKFKDRGFICCDVIRPRTWNNRRVAYFYSQESFLYVSENAIGKYPDLKAASGDIKFVDVVHPELYVNQVVKPSHDWSYLRSMLKRTVQSMIVKAITRQ